MRLIIAVLAALTLMLHAAETPPTGGVDLVDAAAQISIRVKDAGTAEEIPV